MTRGEEKSTTALIDEFGTTLAPVEACTNVGSAPMGVSVDAAASGAATGEGGDVTVTEGGSGDGLESVTVEVGIAGSRPPDEVELVEGESASLLEGDVTEEELVVDTTKDKGKFVPMIEERNDTPIFRSGGGDMGAQSSRPITMGDFEEFVSSADYLK